MCNSTTGSVNSVRKWQIYTIFMKIRSMPPKSNQLFPPSQQCSHASLLKLLPLAQKITHENPILDFSKCRCHLVDRSRSPKSNKLLTLSQQCTYLCKFGQNTSTDSEDNARKRSYADADANVDEIRAKNNMSPLLLVGGHKYNTAPCYDMQLSHIKYSNFSAHWIRISEILPWDRQSNLTHAILPRTSSNIIM